MMRIIQNLCGLALVIMLAINPLEAGAGVNMQNMSYTEEWIDFIIPFENYKNFSVSRDYNSRRSYGGMFGDGWCSEFDVRLDLEVENIPVMRECGHGRSTSFLASSLGDDVKARIAEIIVARLEEYSNTDAPTLAELRESDGLLVLWIDRLDLSFFATSDDEFESASGILLRRVEGGYALIDGSSRLWFDDRGRLVKKQQLDGTSYSLSYSDAGVHSVKFPEGRELLFDYDDDGNMRSIVLPLLDLHAEYEFSRQRYLQRVLNMWGKSYEYSYDSGGNLTSVLFPDGSRIRMEYDEDKDWVILYENRVACTERYDSEEHSPGHYTSSWTRECAGDGQLSSGEHEFVWGEFGLRRIIERSLIRGVHSVTEVTFNEATGERIRTQRDGQEISSSKDIVGRKSFHIIGDTSFVRSGAPSGCLGHFDQFISQGSIHGWYRAVVDETCIVTSLYGSAFGLAVPETESYQEFVLGGGHRVAVDFDADGDVSRIILYDTEGGQLADSKREASSSCEGFKDLDGLIEGVNFSGIVGLCVAFQAAARFGARRY